MEDAMPKAVPKTNFNRDVVLKRFQGFFDLIPALYLQQL